MPQIFKNKYTDHTEDKLKTKQGRDFDGESDSGIVCFDQQNVVACPRSNFLNIFTNAI